MTTKKMKVDMNFTPCPVDNEDEMYPTLCAPFSGLKPAGAVEPAVAEADKALASSLSDALVKLVTDDSSYLTIIIIYDNFQGAIAVKFNACKDLKNL